MKCSLGISNFLEEISSLVVECKVVRALWKTFQQFLKRLHTELLYDPAILVLDVYVRIHMPLQKLKHECSE